MAKPVLIKPVLFPFLVMISLLFSYSSARVLLLHNHLLHNSASLNLALPSDIVLEASENPWELKDSGNHVSPSDMEPEKMSGSRISGKYGPMFLSMLPKGTIPPSGPSGGTNSLNN
ncbi:hypothetical protein K2173_023380 [Erythroxylum novogranatense]|uniref:Uncharacterized protein n=1 Tax=Erythroxylum novogranatense TaxID=1862640 RepID=A0AAV8TVS7_9ROSI|nr:hypothetical protein K2173_023380 [Erythroxylum novogranatense]